MFGRLIGRSAGLLADLIENPHTGGRHIYNRLMGRMRRVRNMRLRDVTRPFGWRGGGQVRVRRPPGEATTIWGGTTGAGNVRRIPAAGEPVWAGTGGGRARRIKSEAEYAAMIEAEAKRIDAVMSEMGRNPNRRMASKALQAANEGALADNVTRSRKPIGVEPNRGMSMGTKLMIGGGALGGIGLGTWAYDRHQTNKLMNIGYSRNYPRVYG